MVQGRSKVCVQGRRRAVSLGGGRVSRQMGQSGGEGGRGGWFCELMFSFGVEIGVGFW